MDKELIAEVQELTELLSEAFATIKKQDKQMKQLSSLIVDLHNNLQIAIDMLESNAKASYEAKVIQVSPRNVDDNNKK